MSLPVTESPALRGALSACPLFAGMAEEELACALRFFEAKTAEYRRGEFLNRIGDPLPWFGLVITGSIQVYMDDLLLPSIFPNIMVFSNESALRIRWPKYWSFSFTSVLPMSTQD